MTTPTDWHAEYDFLLKRVQYLNGIVGSLSGLADYWSDQPGTLSFAEAAESLLAGLQPDQQQAPARPRLMAVPDIPD